MIIIPISFKDKTLAANMLNNYKSLRRRDAPGT